VVLGYLPATLAGGEITLDVAASRAAVQAVADAVGLPSAEAAAAGIIDIVNENMLGGLRLVSVQQGFDPRDFALTAFGGAGPLHANALAKLTGAWPVVVPPSPGVLCALGDATTSARDESARTCLRRFSDLTGAELAQILDELRATTSERMVAQGVPSDEQTMRLEVDVRFFGQGFEIGVEVDPAWLEHPDTALATVADAFDADHQRLFSFLVPADHELVNARVSISGPRPRVTPTVLDEGAGDPVAARSATSPIYVEGAYVDAGIYERSALRAGDVVHGPAIIAEMDSTTLVLPGHQAFTHASGSLLITPTEG